MKNGSQNTGSIDPMVGCTSGIPGYCLPFIDSLAGLSEREKVREIAFYPVHSDIHQWNEVLWKINGGA